MKLYTEEQVRKAIRQSSFLTLATNIYLADGNSRIEDELIDELTTIELPSDEEIDNVASDRFMFGADQGKFINGARWMKQQILKQD